MIRLCCESSPNSIMSHVPVVASVERRSMADVLNVVDACFVKSITQGMRVRYAMTNDRV